MISERHVLTLSEVLAEQEDLTKLCEDRPLVTNELFTPNAYYGMDWVLRLYADISGVHPLRFVLTHGVPLSEFVWEAEIAAPLPVIVYCSPHLSRIYQERSKKIALRVGNPFLYVQDLVAKSAAPKRQGTVFFLSHSSHWDISISDFDLIADRLEQLAEDFHPVTVCIYWRDYNLGHHKAFAKRGLRIVSAGHIYDRNFLIRFFHLCRTHKYATSNHIGSHLFMSVKSGCVYFHLKDITSPRTFDVESGRPVYDRSIPADVRQQLESNFEESTTTITPSQMQFVDNLVGADQKLSRDRMRQLFQFCEMLDRYGTGLWSGQRYYCIPRAPLRKFWIEPKLKVRQRLRAVFKGVEKWHQPVDVLPKN